MNLRNVALCSGLAAITLLLGVQTGCKGKVNNSQPSLLATVRLSLNSSGAQGDQEVTPNIRAGDISDDGRYVVFASKATNLVMFPLVDTNAKSDVFLRDNLNRTTTLISINITGTGTGNGASFSPSISGDGRYVVFSSTSTDLNAEDTDTIQDIYIRDLGAIPPTTRLVSRATGPNAGAPSPAKAAGTCGAPQISKNGRYVVFVASSGAENLDGTVAGGVDNDGFADIYRRDVNDPGGVVFETLLVSRASGTIPIPDGPKASDDCQAPSISRDGNLIAFQSKATNLATLTIHGGPKVSTSQDIFVRNVLAKTTLRLSVAASFPATPDPSGDSSNPCISGDGTMVAFQSNAANLHPDDDGSASDIFIRDVANTTTEIISVHTSGAQAGAGCDHPVLTEDGRFVAFDSPSSNLVNGDSNGVTRDVFLRDRSARTTTRVSVASFGGELNGPSTFPAISLNAKYIIFTSQASNAADDDINGAGDLYMRGPPF